MGQGTPFSSSDLSNVKKLFARAGKALKDIPVPKSKAAKKELKRALTEQIKELKTLSGTLKTRGALIQKYAAEAKKLRAERSAKLNKVMKGYQIMVKNSDGLTSLRPTCVKGLQVLGKSGDKKIQAAALNAFKGHRDAVVKENAAAIKDDPKRKKSLGVFVKGMNAVMGEIAKV